MAIYGHRTRRNRMLAACFVLVFVTLAMVLLRQHDLFNR
jgi:hypothetical protein